jgi:hypothetical protein
MEINLYILLAGGLAIMFFGYFFGLFEGRGQGYKKGKAEAVEKEKEELLEGATPPGPAPIALEPEDPGVLRLKEQDGRLRLDLDGNLVDAETISPAQRKRLIEVLSRMRPWIEARTAAASPASTAAPARTAPPQPRPAPAPTPRSPEPVPPAVVATPNDEPSSARTMVGQINDILQKSIAGTSLASRGIKLQEAPGGGVVVIVGLERYGGVADVPDPEVQAALRAAIAIWERKYTPGL